jgi:hypothetical protein
MGILLPFISILLITLSFLTFLTSGLQHCVFVGFILTVLGKFGTPLLKYMVSLSERQQCCSYHHVNLRSHILSFI